MIQNDADHARENLLLLCRLVIRGLLESIMKSRHRVISPDHPQLCDLFIMIEQVLRHGLKGGKGMLGGLRSTDDVVWNVIERLGKCSKETEEAVNCVQLLPSIRSSLARTRAWLRLALMQKKLADYFQLLVESKDMEEMYEPWALLRHETAGVVFAGSLVGLRVIDCNLYMKESELLAQGREVDLAVYIKIPTIPLEEDQDPDASATADGSTGKNSLDGGDLKTLLDQKSYLEERNKFLLLRIDNLQQQLDLLRGMNKHNVAADNVNNQADANGNSVDGSGLEKPDSPTGGSPGVTSEDSSASSKRQLAKLAETETAMALLEKDVHEKQDTIIMLRSQIDDIKKINLDLYQKLRSIEDSSRQKDKLIAKMEAEKSSIQTSLQEKDLKLREFENKLQSNATYLENLQQELRKKTEFCGNLQNELVDTKQELAELTNTQVAERTSMERLNAKLHSLQSCEKSYLELLEEHDAARKKINEYESTLEEMGVHLEKSKLVVDDLKESVVTMVDAQWEPDKDVDECKQCQKQFSVSRRKHHCRNCGGIYCNTCSENTMPLPSSAKPVRVCDQCYELLLKRFSAKGTTAVTS